MKGYVTESQAETALESIPVLRYPLSSVNLQIFPPVPNVILDGRSVPTASPSQLVVESVRLFGHEPKRILDLGAGTGRAALYLAMQGHKITAIDTDKSGLDWAKDRANDLGIEDDNFKVRQSSLKDLSTTDRYDGIIAEMLLHYLKPHEVRPAVRKIQGLTLAEGINVTSAYTEDNPEQEITLRGLHHLFKEGELQSYYSQWHLHRSFEGYYPKALDRSYLLGKNIKLIPTVVELIVQKPNSASQYPSRHYMNANRQLVPLGN